MGGGEATVRADHAALAVGRGGALDGRQAERVLAGQDVGEEARQDLGADAVGVASDAPAAPAHDARARSCRR